MHLPDFIEIPLRLGLLLAGLLLPGSMLLRALRLPWSLAAAFVTSSTTLYVVVLIFAWTGTTISLATLASALGGIALLARFVPARRSATELSSSFSCFSRQGYWLPLYLVFWSIVAYRLTTQPLSGPDVNFRWSYLAEQMLRFGSLDFYPPRSGADFVRYFWAESIPPGIASLYAWAYACGGGKHALWTSPVVALQLLSLHEIIWRLGSRWGGEGVARRAVLLAAACPLLTWSVLIGQETGLTALAVGGLVWCLHHWREEDGTRWAVLTGIFTVAAASTREYGPVFAGAAVALAVVQRWPRRQTLLLALVALPLSAVWPWRVWLLTGNPLYSLDLGGLFPTNPVFVAWSEVFHAPHLDALSTAADWQALGRYLLLWALPASGGLIALGVLLALRLREAGAVALFVAVTVTLWLLSIPHTAGGLFYSLRVLSPALALLVVAASYGIGLLARQPAMTKLAGVVVALVLLEALPKTLVLPENPYRVNLSDWPSAGGQFMASVQTGQPELVAKLLLLPGRTRILTDNAGLPRVLARIGTEVVPLWSPEVAWLFDRSLAPEEIARRWQKSGLRYLVFGKTGPSADFIHSHARWRAPYFTLHPAAETENYLILEAIAVKAEAP
jgi:hypothetical protein